MVMAHSSKVLLAHRALREIRVILAILDQRGIKEILGRRVSLVLLARKGLRATRVSRVCRAHKATRDRKVCKALRATLAIMLL